MTLIHVEDDEFYPWFNFTEVDEVTPNKWSDRPMNDHIEVDDATLKRWREAIDAAREVQSEIYDAVIWGG